jgi:hypothetical protein
MIAAVRAGLESRAGRGAWIPYRDPGMIVVNRPGLAERGVDVDAVVADLAGRLQRIPGVAQVDTRATLARADTTRDAAARRWLHHLGPGDSAEVMVTLRPRMYFAGIREATHGQATDDDAHVPIVLMGEGVRPGTYARRVSVVDIGPTLARLAGVEPREAVDGRVLAEALR